MSERETVSVEELREILNQELAKREECAGCEVMGSVHRVSEHYPDGGNWNRSLTIKGQPRNPHRCGEVAVEVINQVAARFNLD